MEGVYGTYLSLPLNTTCNVRLDIRILRCRAEPCTEIRGVEEPLRSAIGRFLREFFRQAGFSDTGLEGEIVLECSTLAPLISFYVAATNLIIEELLGVEDLRRFLSSIAVIDGVALGVDPGYTLSLRCTSSFRAPCIARGVNEVLRLQGVANISIDGLLSIHHMEVQGRSPAIPRVVEANRRIVSLYLKVVSTVMPEIIDFINLQKEENEKYLRLVLYMELALSGVSLSKWVRLPKVVPDINAMAVYNIRVLS